MTKEHVEILKDVTKKEYKKAKLYVYLYFVIGIVFLAMMVLYQIVSYALTLTIIIIIMYFLYRYVFIQYFFIRNYYLKYLRTLLYDTYDITDETISYFTFPMNERLYEDGFEILFNSNVYLLASHEAYLKEFYTLQLAVYNLDERSMEVSPTVKELSREMASFTVAGTAVKVILLVADTFDEETKEILKYDGAPSNNTVVVGLEKATNTFHYNTFLNEDDLDIFYEELFNLSLNDNTK